MAGKPKRMSLVKQILRMHSRGKGIKTIARNLEISKNTVKSYIHRANISRIAVSSLLALEDPELEAALLAGNPAYRDPRYEPLKKQLDYYTAELKKVGVTRLVLWEEYKVAHPTSHYCYSQFCVVLRQHRLASKPSLVLEHHPADKLYIDFAGKPLSYIDKETGEEISVQVFVACLSYSDYSFAMAIPSQKTDDFIYALQCCLKDMGGVPQTLVPDNLKAAVTKASRYEPSINRVLEDFANHYGTTVTPARVRKPKDKALVENQVKLIYSRVYAKLRNQQFFDLTSLNKAIKDRIKAHNQTRMQRKEYSREEKFIADEKQLLLPLPENDFEVKYYKSLKVTHNNHIYISSDKHHYSVPYTYIGKQTRVIYTRSMVRIFGDNGQLIAVHPRSFKKSGYTTTKEHLCSHHQYYKKRSPTYYIQKGYNHSETLYQYINALFKQDKYPEQLYRTCEGILKLSKQTDTDQFIKACEMAMEFTNYSYAFLKRILENKMVDATDQTPETPLPKHDNIRGASSFK
ncbi:transposase [Aquimarina muelleri]|uniref:Transposase n=2 Tax=Aquimarina muelleri TaxID=279356 RepID=A0A918JZA0_9FLAO|nr:transposase [Aquimarina muelleri]